MKGAYVVHLTKCSETSMVASVKIARWLSEYLGVPLLDTADKVKEVLKSKPRAALLVNSPTGFAPSDMRWATAELVNVAKEYIFVNNDYKMLPPSQVQRIAEKRGVNLPLRPSVWSTVPSFGWKQPQDHYVNWNQLTYHPLKRPADRVYMGLFYWGALRGGREDYFMKYLDTDEYPVTISTPKVSWKKWRGYIKNEDVKLTPPCQDLIKSASGYQATIYIEDKKSHSVYCSPANRFYEALSARTLMLVDQNAANTLKTAGFKDVDAFTVDDPKTVRAALGMRSKLLPKQQRTWMRGFQTELKKQVAAAVKSLKKVI